MRAVAGMRAVQGAVQRAAKRNDHASWRDCKGNTQRIAPVTEGHGRKEPLYVVATPPSTKSHSVFAQFAWHRARGGSASHSRSSRQRQRPYGHIWFARVEGPPVPGTIEPPCPPHRVRDFIARSQKGIRFSTTSKASGCRHQGRTLRPGPSIAGGWEEWPARSRTTRRRGREREIAAAVAEGLSNGEIGARLHVSVGTVKAHLQRTEQAGPGEPHPTGPLGLLGSRCGAAACRGAAGSGSAGRSTTSSTTSSTTTLATSSATRFSNQPVVSSPADATEPCISSRERIRSAGIPQGSC
ncbi:LuxR C-terminal-related transcriptional regulator [Streptomyces inhibens]|uniref:LuxR C-terminal-related transcriptional regulator n=1 Tax=Streptomyces inhibens TaxID=2293571 RepID=UPI00402AC5DA